MAAALFSEMSHPHGDPNTSPSPARFSSVLTHMGPVCSSHIGHITQKCIYDLKKTNTNSIMIMIIIKKNVYPHF